MRWIVAAAVTSVLAAGCGRPRATILSATGAPDAEITYDSATFQLARGERVQIVFFRRVPAPLGEADPDHEIVVIELPERSVYGWVREDHVQAWRWVHARGPDGRMEDRLWHLASGEAEMDFEDLGLVLDFECHATLVPIGETGGGVWVFEANLEVREDAARTQGLLNRYGEWLRSLVAEARAPDEEAP